MIEASVSRRGPFAFWYDLGRGWFQGDLSVGSLKATRRQARRFAQTGIECLETVYPAVRRRSGESPDYRMLHIDQKSALEF